MKGKLEKIVDLYAHSIGFNSPTSELLTTPQERARETRRGKLVNDGKM